eukprot:TRINITY_DN2262_c0_g1_i1.p1 TRINITY_DN2262_c0_g1~~TRINITY_DN2262_c0_g1_i1.p1  ORF type:complete len:442 (+),score=114.53 TRINITY_DN2262_c0_g1_i1:95-1327(+)
MMHLAYTFSEKSHFLSASLFDPVGEIKEVKTFCLSHFEDKKSPEGGNPVEDAFHAMLEWARNIFSSIGFPSCLVVCKFGKIASWESELFRRSIIRLSQKPSAAVFDLILSSIALQPVPFLNERLPPHGALLFMSSKSVTPQPLNEVLQGIPLPLTRLSVVADASDCSCTPGVCSYELCIHQVFHVEFLSSPPPPQPLSSQSRNANSGNNGGNNANVNMSTSSSPCLPFTLCSISSGVTVTPQSVNGVHSLHNHQQICMYHAPNSLLRDVSITIARQFIAMSWLPPNIAPDSSHRSCNCSELCNPIISTSSSSSPQSSFSTTTLQSPQSPHSYHGDHLRRSVLPCHVVCCARCAGTVEHAESDGIADYNTEHNNMNTNNNNNIVSNTNNVNGINSINNREQREQRQQHEHQ